MKYSQTLFNTEILKNKLILCAKELELNYPYESFDIVIVGGAALILLMRVTK